MGVERVKVPYQSRFAPCQLSQRESQDALPQQRTDPYLQFLS